MNSDADKLWDDLAGKLRKKQGFCPLTPEEAEAAFNDAPAEPLSADRINSIVESATSREQDSWTPDDDDDWDGDSALDEAAEGKYQLYRNEGEITPETDKKEEDLRRKMLSDDEPEEDET